MYGYVCLCMAMKGSVWVCRAVYIHTHVGLCMAMFGCVWLCRAMYGYVGLCMLCIVSNLSIDSPFVISDHAAVHFHLMLKKPVLEKKLITFRKLRSIDFDSFGSDITNSSLPHRFRALMT